jgi:hypothetical protein
MWQLVKQVIYSSHDCSPAAGLCYKNKLHADVAVVAAAPSPEAHPAGSSAASQAQLRLNWRGLQAQRELQTWHAQLAGVSKE